MADSDISGRKDTTMDRLRRFGRKADATLRKYTGGDYYDRSTANVKKKFSEVAPKTADAVQKTADFLGRGAAYTEIPGGGPLLGMAKKAKPRAAADLVRGESSARAKFANGPKPRPAADVKPGSARAQAAKGPQPKIQGSGTLSDRLGAAKKDGGAKVNPSKYNPLPQNTTVKEIPKTKSRTLAKVGAGAAVASGAGAAYMASGNRGAPSVGASEVRKAAGTPTASYEPKRVNDTGVRKTTNKFEPKAKAAGTLTSAYEPKKATKSKTRIAFEKEFAANRKAGKKVFKFRGGSYNTKLAK